MLKRTISFIRGVWDAMPGLPVEDFSRGGGLVGPLRPELTYEYIDPSKIDLAQSECEGDDCLRIDTSVDEGDPAINNSVVPDGTGLLTINAPTEEATRASAPEREVTTSTRPLLKNATYHATPPARPAANQNHHHMDNTPAPDTVTTVASYHPAAAHVYADR